MAERLTPEQEARIRQNHAATTQGEWCLGGSVHDWRICLHEAKPGNCYDNPLIYAEDDHLRAENKADARFIAAAHQDVPALLTEIDALRSERDWFVARSGEGCPSRAERPGDCTDYTTCADCLCAIMKKAMEELFRGKTPKEHK